MSADGAYLAAMRARRALPRRCHRQPPAATLGIVRESAAPDRTLRPWPTLAATGGGPTSASRPGWPQSRPAVRPAIIPSAEHSCRAPLHARDQLAKGLLLGA